LKLDRVPLSLVATLAALPSISEIPFLDCSFAATSPNFSAETFTEGSEGKEQAAEL
jgi:hypothetical protein